MAKYDLLKFTTNVRTYKQAGAIERSPEDLGYHFINTGSVLCYVNNIPLYPSGVLDTMYEGYKDESLYNVRFDSTAGSDLELTVLTFTSK
jgi:hypothetical protein